MASSQAAGLWAGRWPLERVRAWRERDGFRTGANFAPSTASNQLEMWQEETFDEATIAKELGWAREKLGMSVVRVFLHDLAFLQDEEGFLARVESFLRIAEGSGIKTMLVLFDGCWSPTAEEGPQAEPVPGVHNSRWLQSPSLEGLRRWHGRWGGAAPGLAAARGAVSRGARLAEEAAVPLAAAAAPPATGAATRGEGGGRSCDREGDHLERYVKSVMRRFRDDGRVHSWDLYNEADNTVIELNMFLLGGGRSAARYLADRLLSLSQWLIGHVCAAAADRLATRWTTGWRDLDMRFELLERTIGWAREVGPSQPITFCEWELSSRRFSRLARDHADFGSFHRYASGGKTRLEAERMRAAYGERPLFLTEYLARPLGSTFEGVLPVCRALGVSAICWGLVAGKTNTVHPWWSWMPAARIFSTWILRREPGAEPGNWFHDVLRDDGEPRYLEEAALLQAAAAHKDMS